MKRVHFLFLSFCMAWISSARAEEGAPPPPPPEVEGLPFPIGEKLTYTIYWGIIAVGESVATTEWAYDEGQWFIKIRFRTQTNGILAKLYPVDDVVDTYIDPLTLRPILHLLGLNEGGNIRKSYTRFDWEKNQAVYVKEHEDKEDEVKVIPLKEDSRDLVSFMYFLRRTPFEAGKTYDFEVLSDYKLYDLSVETGEIEKIRLAEYGKTESLKLKPEAQFEGIFVRKGKIDLWLSADERQLLTKLVVDTPFANIKLLLKSVEGPGAEDWEKKN